MDSPPPGPKPTAAARSDAFAPSPGSQAVDAGWSLPARIRELATARPSLEVLYVHAPFAAEFDHEGTRRTYDEIVGVMERTLLEFLSELGCEHGLQRWPADDLVAWIAHDPNRGSDHPRAGEGLEAAATLFLREALARDVDLPRRFDRFDELTVARASVEASISQSFGNEYARALRRAQQQACDPAARELQLNTATIDRALEQRAFLYHYQPIVDCSKGEIFAHEALCRGTLDSLRYPDTIFKVAERCDRIWDLGRILRDLIAAGLDVGIESAQTPLLFVNVHPLDIEDPVFLDQALCGPLSRHASRVVIELTERAAIRDYRRVKAFFAKLRRFGYRLAIDDLGSGYAGLTALAELEPEFIKFDMELIRDIHLHPIKQRLLKRMSEFAREMRAQTISEGVETLEERDALLEVDCHLMQGYFFARPGPGFAGVPADRFPSATTPRAAASSP